MPINYMIRYQDGAKKMREIKLDFIKNTRDLGGYKTIDGKEVVPSRLIRSAAFWKVSDRDKEYLLNELHVDKLIDFRNDDEMEQSQDVKLDGVENIHLPIFGGSDNEDMLSRLQGDNEHTSFMDKIRVLYDQIPGFSIYQMMAQNYVDFVTNDFCISQFRKFLDILINEDPNKAIIYHCAGGKDRTGAASALILALLGVDDATIKEDYMLTGKYVEAENSKRINQAKLAGADIFAEILDGTMNVKEEYIDAMLNTMHKDGDTTLEYIKKYFHVTEQEILILRGKYLTN